LRATGKPLCLLINFGRTKVEIRRITAQACSQKNPLHPCLSRFIRLKKRLPRASTVPATPSLN
jgi:hypothetical protein